MDLAPGAALLLLERAERGRPAPVVRMVNRAFAELTGLAAESVAGRSLRALRGVLEGDAAFAELAAAAQVGAPYAGRLRLRVGDGRAVAAGARAPDGRPELYLVWLEPQRALGAAPPPTAAPPSPRAVPGATAGLLAALGQGCFYELAVDLDCRLRLASAGPGLGELTGYALDELGATGGFFALAAPGDRGQLHRRNQRLLAGLGGGGPVRYRLRRKSGELRWVEDTALPERDPETGLVVRVVGVLRDSGDLGRAAAAPALARQALAVLREAAGAALLLVDLQGRLRGVEGPPELTGLDRLRDRIGQPLSGPLGAARAAAWLDWVDEAAGASETVRCRLPWPGGGGERLLEASLAGVGEELVQVILWAPPEAARLAAAAAAAPGLQAVLDALREPLLVVTPDLRVRAVNRALERLTGRGRAELVGAPVAERLAAPPARGALLSLLRGVLARGAEGEARLALACSLRGGEGELELRVGALPAEGRPAGALLIEARRVEEKGAVAAPAASDGESWLNAVMNSVADGIVLLDARGTVSWLSRSAEAIFDYPRDAAVGASVDLLLPPEAPGAGVLDRLGAAARAAPFEVPIRRRSGELIPVEVEASAFEEGGRRTVVLAVRDITVRQQTEETLRSLAYHDPLTGLPNRLLFHDRLSQAIERARRNRQLLTVMLVDLDRFKLINDSLGLATGDQVIKGVADRLVQALRKSDTVARLGGDEFMLLLLGTSGAEAAAKVAQKVLDCLRPPLAVDAHELTTSASVGIALFPHDGDDADGLVKNADNALSRAKEQGRDRYQFYTDDMNAAAFERLMLESRLRKALEQGELVLHYQPKVSLADGAVVGVEALLRWFHPDLGLVPPAEFIPLAEETGLIVPIGTWVLRTACAQLGRWHRSGHAGLQLAVNLSARQFQEPNLVATVAAAVREGALPAGALELELTESVIMRDAPETVRRLRELTALGIRLAIDDFGTGYSSLGYLKAFPIGALKIDRSFVRDVERDPNSAALARAIIALATSLKLKVVAEGVETREQLDLLRGFGCHEMQGYLFSRPLPAEELAGLLAAGRRLALSPTGALPAGGPPFP